MRSILTPAMALLCLGLDQHAMSQVPSYVPATWLLAWYSFNGDATDLSNQGHNGIVNGPVIANDRCGSPNGAYFFDGADDYIELTGTETWIFPAFTLSA